jgi:hypothetical protein
MDCVFELTDDLVKYWDKKNISNLNGLFSRITQFTMII